jgi:hypothetical protein
LGNFIDCERGKSKEHKCEGIFWEEALQWKRKSKIEWSKEVEITKQSLSLSKGSASDLLPHN